MNDITYKTPSIKEAVFDIKFVFEKQVEIELFEELYQKLSVEYPKKEILNQQTVSFKVGHPTEPDKVETIHGTNGIKLTSIDGLHIVQFRPDGLTFSRMEPYSGWSLFSKEADKLISIYIDILKPKYINRLALRFINLVKIPETTFNLEEYFNTYPNLADGIEATTHQFFMRQLIQDKKEGVFAIINQTTADNKSDDGLTRIMFDLDVFKENINLQFASKEYNLLLSHLRAFRSQIFESSITEKIRNILK